MELVRLIVMCGLSGSGKSTVAKELAAKYNATIFSSDALREELFGDVNEQKHNQELFAELHRRIKECLRHGKSAIYDACNLNYKKRMAFLAELKNIQCSRICVLVATPYEECLKRNAARDRKVPEYVIERQYRQFDVPCQYYEGWGRVDVVFPEGLKRRRAIDFLDSVNNFSQDNPHHALTLGGHCNATWEYLWDKYGELNRRSAVLMRAGALHDCGKCFTKTFTNSKGEPTDVAHYYNHEHTGSYDSLFYGPEEQALDVAVLIRWHMMPYVWEKDNNGKLHSKYRRLWGEWLYEDIMRLHEADKAAH